MYPNLIQYGDFIIPTFFTMVMVGALVATFFLYYKAPKVGLSQVTVLDIGMVGTLFGVLGGRLFHVFAEAFWFYQEDWTHIFEFWRGGFVSYGAFILGSAAVIVYLLIRKQPLLKYLDLGGLSLPIVVFFIRVGCLGAGCCHGKPTDFFIHLVFNNPASTAGSVYLGLPLHATQIYSMINAVLLFAFLNWRYKRRLFDGEIILLFFMIYPVMRGLVEILRGDVDRGVYFDGLLSTGQITGAIIFVVAGLIYFYLFKKHKHG